MDSHYHNHLLRFLSGKNYSINVISKSGATLEPALAFRFFWKELSQRFTKEELREKVFVTTDAHKGRLRDLCKAPSFAMLSHSK